MEEQEEKTTCLLLSKSWTSPERRERPHLVPPKVPAQNSVLLDDAKAKWLEKISCYLWFHNKILRNGSLWVALYNPAIRAILWKSREEWQNPLCASICAIIIHQGKWEKEGNEQEGLLPLALTPSAELAVPLLCYTSISTPPTSSHSYPAPVPDPGAQEGKKIQQRNLKNQDWSVKKCQKEFIIGTN